MFKDSLEQLPASLSVTPLLHRGLGNSSYVVDLGDGGALVVDPQRDPRPYLGELRERGLRPRVVIETHLHADFVSGSRELVAAGAELWAPAGSDLSYPHRALHDEEELDLGGLSLRVIATPGHTPEHLAYTLVDGSRPGALFSGGTLMAGGAARTDLISPDRTEQLARATYRSITERLFTLPDNLPVYATHGGGSFCSVGAGGGHVTTIGREKASNLLFAGDPDEEIFVARMLAGYGSYPPYFLELRDVNRNGVETFGERPPALARLSVAGIERLAGDGASVVDVRDLRSFAEGHVPGTISIPWRPAFATWLGWLVPRTSPVVFVADDTVDRDDLVWAALNVGFDNLLGELDGGIAAWKESGRPANEIAITEEGDDQRQVVDVRQTSEYHSGHATGAVLVELGSLAVSTEDVPNGPLLVHCGHGARAMTAASLLSRAGYDDVSVLVGPPNRLGPLVTSEDI